MGAWRLVRASLMHLQLTLIVVLYEYAKNPLPAMLNKFFPHISNCAHREYTLSYYAWIE
jgi:hypothetical protein